MGNSFKNVIVLQLVVPRVTFASSKTNAFLFICIYLHVSISETRRYYSTHLMTHFTAWLLFLFLNMSHFPVWILISPFLDTGNIINIASTNIQNRFWICERARPVCRFVTWAQEKIESFWSNITTCLQSSVNRLQFGFDQW